MKILESEIVCSAFTAVLENDVCVFGRNYDFSKTNTCIVKTNPKHGYKSISTIDLQFLGLDVNKDVEELMNRITYLAAPNVLLDGINEKGGSCAIFISYQGGDNDVKYNLHDSANTSFHYMIADASGRRAIL